MFIFDYMFGDLNASSNCDSWFLSKNNNNLSYK